MAQLLIIDDEPSICWGLKKLAESLGHVARTASSAEAGLREAEKSPSPDAVFLDVRLPGLDGLSAMPLLRERLPDVPILVMTAHGELETAVEAIRNGAFEYLTKPFDLTLAEKVLDRALRRRPSTVSPPATLPELQNQIVGHSPVLQDVFKQIALVAASDACVLVSGESGTGKELVARAIHRYSRRSDGPFVPVHVAALSPMLAESELFGHVRGAFTGADAPRTGLLEQAQGGTVFLDEVADIPLALQIKLLRALEHGEIVPVGSDKPRTIDFRLLSATHQDLREKVAAGSFRHDLFFRLVTFQIELPPLRERGPDILELTEHFIGNLTAKNQLPRPTLSKRAEAELNRRPWHGNVRELRNAIEHAVIMARGGQIEPDQFPPPAPSAGVTTDAEPITALSQLIRQWTESRLQENGEQEDLYERFLSLVEPPLLRATLTHELGQCTAAARKLGLHRHTLRKKLDQYGIE
ncbi:MAG: two-component system NtrC family nitrogen regulation response regulator GlnG [Planctomycetota bacterium]|nr:MAG: two-component system NtrC family nitrogen regulation response regulator GlnG [Planctomycetota bacterium]